MFHTCDDALATNAYISNINPHHTLLKAFRIGHDMGRNYADNDYTQDREHSYEGFDSGDHILRDCFY